MNERIKQLLKQSNYDARYCSEDFDPAKFAELIIQECITKAKLRREFAIEDEHNVDEAFSLLIYDIESHFGVEE